MWYNVGDVLSYRQFNGWVFRHTIGDGVKNLLWSLSDLRVTDLIDVCGVRGHGFTQVANLEQH